MTAIPTLESPILPLRQHGRELERAVARLGLDLTGLTVLTEAATGPYVVTPVLAALAGAQVIALTKETRHGTVAEVREQTAALTAAVGVDAGQVRVVDQLTPELVGAADVITNSGHLRPLDARTLRHVKDSAVIPLMYEAWEWRAGDLDLDFARRRGIKVGATNERHPDVGVFDFLGEMAVKLVHDAGLSLRHHRFVLVTNNDFGPYIARALGPLCAGLAVVDLDENEGRYVGAQVDWVGGFPHVSLPPSYDGVEAVLLAAYPFDHCWIGAHGEVSLETFTSEATRPLVLRYVGDVDAELLTAAGFPCFPAVVPSGHMGVLPSAIGFDPIIRLQSGGLRAAQAMLDGTHQVNGTAIVEML